MRDSVVSKQYAYVLRNGFGLEVVDVTDEANPSLSVLTEPAPI